MQTLHCSPVTPVPCPHGCWRPPLYCPSLWYHINIVVAEVWVIVCTPRSQVQTLLLEKPVNAAKLIVRSRKTRFIQCGHFWRRDKEIPWPPVHLWGSWAGTKVWIGGQGCALRGVSGQGVTVWTPMSPAKWLGKLLSCVSHLQAGGWLQPLPSKFQWGITVSITGQSVWGIQMHLWNTLISMPVT